MQDEPSGAALIEAARRALTEDVIPGLSGRPRYVALMVANALGIAARDIGEGEARSEATAAILGGDDGPSLVRSLREGRHDADPDLHAALTRQVTVNARIWKPRAA